METTDVIRRGDVLYAAAIGTQLGIRPAIVVSNNKANATAPIITVVPITSRTKDNFPTHVILNGYEKILEGSTALCEQVSTIDKKNLSSYICSLDAVDMVEVDNALKRALGFIKA